MPAIINELPNHSQSHKIDYVKLITERKEYDITEMFVSMQIFEDIRDGVLNADVAIINSNNLISTMPIIGREYVKISFSSRDNSGRYFEPYVKTFKLVSIDNVQHDPNNGMEVYKMSLISKTYFEQNKVKISKSYNTTPDKIVTDLFTTLGETISVEECLHKRNFIVPNITPFDFINFLTNECVSKINESSDYVFFENKDGFHFKSLYTLSKNEKPIVIDYKLNSASSSDHRLNARYISIGNYFNALNHYNGICGSRVITHDIIKKKQIVNSTDYYKYKEEFPNMNGGNIFIDDTQPQIADSKLILEIADTVYEPHTSEAINQRLKRLNNKGLFALSDVTVALAGNIDIKSGEVIYLNYLDEYNKPDLIRSGRYVITKIKHDVSRVEYMMTIECSKDSFIPTGKKLK